LWFQDEARIGQSEQDQKTIRGIVFPENKITRPLLSSVVAARGARSFSL
jgi:co-chaperonin GroES (HSP10)